MAAFARDVAEAVLARVCADYDSAADMLLASRHDFDMDAFVGVLRAKQLERVFKDTVPYDMTDVTQRAALQERRATLLLDMDFCSGHDRHVIEMCHTSGPAKSSCFTYGYRFYSVRASDVVDFDVMRVLVRGANAQIDVGARVCFASWDFQHALDVPGALRRMYRLLVRVSQ